MQGTIMNFRRGKHNVNHRQMIITVESVNSKEKANKLVGKEVTWKSPAKKEIKGKVSAPHGGKGYFRAIMDKGLPGQAIGEKINIK